MGIFISTVTFVSIPLSSGEALSIEIGFLITKTYEPTDLSPALVGLVLTYCIAVTSNSQYTIKQSAEVENTVSQQYHPQDYISDFS